jgi:hypothetical protein
MSFSLNNNICQCDIIHTSTCIYIKICFAINRLALGSRCLFLFFSINESYTINQIASLARKYRQDSTCHQREDTPYL